ncbi:hypothetical protein EV681_3276 [Advenella incenata]|uniref:Uncharacterized protein n=1 Tax=Advenella incenata TaxID=267800 RepID=A0A4Q7VEW6_9BURK|nr:hypothetical protein EV681_3276 [Advenella incenata]
MGGSCKEEQHPYQLAHLKCTFSLLRNLVFSIKVMPFRMTTLGIRVYVALRVDDIEDGVS